MGRGRSLAQRSKLSFQHRSDSHGLDFSSIMQNFIITEGSRKISNRDKLKVSRTIKNAKFLKLQNTVSFADLLLRQVRIITSRG